MIEYIQGRERERVIPKVHCCLVIGMSSFHLGDPGSMVDNGNKIKRQTNFICIFWENRSCKKLLLWNLVCYFLFYVLHHLLI